MLTAVGRFLRKLRIDRGEMLRTMAGTLGVSVQFLSDIENGKRKMPDSWLPMLREKYGLTDEQLEELKQAVISSGDTVDRNIRNAAERSRELTEAFARQVAASDGETDGDPDK